MKIRHTLLVAVFLIATSFTTFHSSNGPTSGQLSRDSTKTLRCGPAFNVIKEGSSGSISVVSLTRSGTTLLNTTSPAFPIYIEQTSSGTCVLHARVSSSSTVPMAVVVKDHYSGETYGCDANQPNGILHVEFFGACQLYDIVFTSDLSVCGF